MTEITFNLKPQGDGEPFPVTIDQESTVAQLKEKVSEKTSIAKDHIKLMFKGRILKDDQKLTEAKIENGVTIIVVDTNADANKPSSTAVIAEPK